MADKSARAHYRLVAEPCHPYPLIMMLTVALLVVPEYLAISTSLEACGARPRSGLSSRFSRMGT